MAYSQHRSDLIHFDLQPGGALTLVRVISGLDWFREVALNGYLTPMEAAAVLNVHRVTMYDWINQGLLTRYVSDEGEAWLLWGEVYQFGRTRGLVA